MNETKLIVILKQALADAPGNGIVVALSGGLDSSALLNALASLPEARERGLRTVHIDHGLHADSSHWVEHCRGLAQSLSVPFESVAVAVTRTSGDGLEAAARGARYAALAQHLGDGELLAVAQHRDDQSETVVLKLMRGAGPEGLGGMRPLRPFARGQLWRPLLSLPRSALKNYADTHAIKWLDDPSNADETLSRNFVRRQILPRLRQHWRECDTALSHSAQWNRSAADFILDQARRALARLQGLDRTTLRWAEWLALPEALRDPVLRLWLRDLRLAEPTHAQANELQRQLRDAAAQSLPCVRWAGAEMRRYRNLLYAMPLLQAPHEEWQTDWRGEGLRLPANCGELTLENIAHTATELPILLVRFRRGGESLRPVANVHTRELRLLFQESGIPPWQRGRIPLVYHGKSLLAVGDLWLSEVGAKFFAAHQCRLIWQPTDFA
jgi:tRNA(Ile)-lysidine synthase